MDDNASPIATLFERVEDYSKTTVELFKLNAIDKSAEVVSSLVFIFAICITVALSLLIVNIGFALWIGKYFDDSFYGFIIIGGFYAILALLLYIFRNQWIKYPVSKSVINKMLKQK